MTKNPNPGLFIFPFLFFVRFVRGEGGGAGQGCAGQGVCWQGSGSNIFICDQLYQPNTHCLTFVSPSAFSRRAVVSYWRKYVHEVLVNRLGGLSLPRKSLVRLTDRPDMTLDVYRGRKTTIQHCLTFL